MLRQADKEDKKDGDKEDKKDGEDQEDYTVAPTEAQEIIRDGAVYWESLLIGGIDGFTSDFNDSCTDGLIMTVTSAFSVLDNIAIYDPRNFAKFNISNVALTEATNMAYAFCDLSQLVSQFEKLVDFSNPDQYLVLVSRVGGAMINEVPAMWKCIQEGQEK